MSAIPYGGGDDLEDDFAGQVSGSESEGYELEELEAAAPSSDPAAQEQEQPESSATASRKRKQVEKTKERKAKKRKLAETKESIPPESIAAQPPHELARLLATMQAKTFSKYSELELEDILIPETSIADTTTWIGSRNLDELVPFIIKALPTLHTRLSQKSKASGAPTLLFVTSAALRVADVTRSLKSKKLRGEKGGDVAKLFAKHFKLAEHVSYLKRTKVGAAVGTPGRVGKLLCETDALTISALSHIMLDVTYRDGKQRSLLDIPETRDEVFKTVLGGPAVLQAIKSGKIQVVLF